MKNCFNLKCGEEEITLLKRDVKFSNGYGIVRALVGIYDEEDNFGLAKCLAVVDSNFKEAIPFMEEKDVLEILILNKGNILIKLLNDDEEIVLHFTFRAADIKFFAQLNCLNFFKVDNNIVQLEQIFDNWAKFALYDVNEKKLISDFYNVIGSFIYNSRLEQEVALANYYILDEQENVRDIISTFINKKGEVVVPFKSLFMDVELKATCLEEAKTEVQELMMGRGRTRR